MTPDTPLSAGDFLGAVMATQLAVYVLLGIARELYLLNQDRKNSAYANPD